MKFKINMLNEMVDNAIQDKQRIDEMANTLAADVNEILLGYFILGGSWNNFENKDEAVKTLSKRKTQISPEEYKDQEGRAKEMATEILTWAENNEFEGSVIKCWWTARPGMLTLATDVQVDSRKNPTDTLIQFADGTFLGISAKSTKGAGDIGFKNPGVGSLSRELGIDLIAQVEHIEQKMIQKHDLPMNKRERKLFIRHNPEVRQDTVNAGIKVLHILRNHLFKHYTESLTNEEMKKHILNVWMDSDEVFPKYIKVTGHGKNGKYHASLMDPLKNPKIDALATERVAITPIGNESIGVSAGNVRLFKIRFKYESEKLATSLKLTADPW